MPIFEFECLECRKRFSALVGVIAQPRETKCPGCGGITLEKLVSRFSRVRSEDEAMDTLANEVASGDMENDPRAMKRWMKELSSAMDEDMAEDIDQSLDEEFSGTTKKSSKSDDTVY